MLGAEAVIQSLVQEGVSHIFGQSQVDVCPLLQAMREHSPQLHFTLVRNQEQACHMASGYGRISGKIGVCLVSSSAISVVAGIATAFADHIPLVILAGQSKNQGQSQNKQMDLGSCVRNVVKQSFLLKEVEDIPRLVKEAFFLAGTGRTGPVLLEIPADLLVAELSHFQEVAQVNIPGYQPPGLEKDFEIKRAVTLFHKAKRPVLLVGGTVFLSNVEKKVRNFAERHNLPVISTVMGLGIFPTNHPLNLGVIGGRGKARERALATADLLVAIGVDLNPYLSLPELETLPPVLHLEVSASYHHAPEVLSLVGDLKDMLNQLNKAITPADCHPQRTDLQNLRQEELLHAYGCQGIHPAHFFRLLGRKINEDAVLCVDSGLHQDWASQHLLFQEKTRFLSCTSGGGYALGCAIGVKLARQRRQTFVICGDGGFQRSFAELSAVLAHHLDLKIILFQNQVLGRAYQAQKSSYGSGFCTELEGSPDFLALAHAYGIPAGRISQETEVEIALEYFLEERGTQLLIVEVTKDITDGNIPDSKEEASPQGAAPVLPAEIAPVLKVRTEEEGEGI